MVIRLSGRVGRLRRRNQDRGPIDSLGAEGRRSAGPLTRRERQVLGLIAGGMRDGDIANALSLSQHTVHRHVSNIYAKLGCSTRASAVAKATERGML